MLAGRLGFIDTPAQGNARPDGVEWCADNGCFSDQFDVHKWWAWLEVNADHASSCAFAVAPDVVADHAATLARSMPWLPKIRALGYPVAFVLQDGASSDTVPWDDIDAVFVGGGRQFACSRRYGITLAEWKLGPHARQLVTESKLRGKWVHMGRVNSFRRIEYAAQIGCDSADGTYLRFGPDKNLPKLLTWLDRLDTQPFLPEAING